MAIPRFALLFVLVCLAACSSVVDPDIDTDASLSGTADHYADVTVNRLSQPYVRVHPTKHPRRPPTAILLAPRMLQDMPNGQHVASEIGRVFWQTFLEEEVFPILEYSEQTPWRGRDQALARARFRGADLALGMEITYLIAGGSTSKSGLSVRLHVYEVVSGQLLWTMEHSGSMKPGLNQQNIFYMERPRMPQDPLFAISTVLARDMAGPLKSWTTPVEHPESDDQPGEPGTEAKPGAGGAQPSLF